MKLRNLAIAAIGLSGLAAPALAEPWHGNGRVVIEIGGRNPGPDWNRDRGNVGELINRQDRLAEQIRVGERQGWLDRYEVRRAWEALDQIRDRTQRAEWRFGRYLPEREMRSICEQMDRLDAYLDREARDRRWRR